MRRYVTPAILTLAVTAAAVSGCMDTRVYIRDGDANSVQLGYGGDVHKTLPRARQHCAQFERVPRFVEADGEVATYDCVRP